VAGRRRRGGPAGAAKNINHEDHEDHEGAEPIRAVLRGSSPDDSDGRDATVDKTSNDRPHAQGQRGSFVVFVVFVVQ